MRLPVRGVGLFLAVLCLLNTNYSRASKEWTTPLMTTLSSRLQPVFAKTKTVCFGRFMVEIPESSIVAWGPATLELGIGVFPNRADEVKEAGEKFAQELRSTKAISHEYVPLLLSEELIARPPGKIITGYESFDAIKELKINGYFSWDNDGVIIDARPLLENRNRAVEKIKSIAQRLRLRGEGEIPSEPGNCIESAFLADRLVEGEEPPSEHVRIGFRLKEFPDTHLSIRIGPSNPHHSEGNSFEWRLAQLERELKAENPDHPRLKTRYMRRGPRQIQEWLNGWEALSHSPGEPGVHGIHDFIMQFKGVPGDLLKPYADIRMQTGVADNAAGAIKPSLTDDEAVAVWDSITSSIRVRPPGMALGAADTTKLPPRLPLGELVATGRACPQTGWWEPSEPGDVLGGRRQRFRAGEQMSHALLLGPQTLWQKLKGERPTHRTATVWQLVGYDQATAAQPSSAPARMNVTTGHLGNESE